MILRFGVDQGSLPTPFFDIYYFQKISASRVFTVEAEDFA